MGRAQVYIKNLKARMFQQFFQRRAGDFIAGSQAAEYKSIGLRHALARFLSRFNAIPGTRVNNLVARTTAAG